MNNTNAMYNKWTVVCELPMAQLAQRASTETQPAYVEALYAQIPQVEELIKERKKWEPFSLGTIGSKKI
ncbi:hypothetical protein N7472_004440 [Penicillium cf. griseofulvum]|uniref:Uncharacterized protein n=1 Tax=Penicillium cf. griseofulvum TaxID=2972120 RepID=A0A9W9JNE9_9EURO|nr:hypothetical protein N7472_004440 [Penicillium cf. griseofulvum]KAJ5442000.1 hypothetical protein N7445_005007 [Penicillium cf. griseofulvum]